VQVGGAILIADEGIRTRVQVERVEGEAVGATYVDAIQNPLKKKIKRGQVLQSSISELCLALYADPSASSSRVGCTM
jgi:hypothetical protein